jgi:hypothetical protein
VLDYTGPIHPFRDAGQTGVSSASSDASTGDAGSPTGKCSSDDAGCTSLANCGPQVPVLQIFSPAPKATGGNLSDGTYVMSDYRLYMGTGGGMRATTSWFRETVQIATVGGDAGSGPSNDAGAAGDVGAPDATASPSSMFSDISENDQSPTNTSSGSLIVQGSSIALVYDCPGGRSPFLVTYTADPGEVILFVPDQGAGVGQITYRKQ